MVGAGRFEARLPTGVTELFCPRRKALDKVLVDAAVAAGVELREGFSVQEVMTDGGRVTGIRGQGSGAAATESARIVIGADGMHSVIARGVQAAEYNARPSLTCAYYSYWSGVPSDGLEWYPRPEEGSLAGLFRTNDGMVCIIVMRRHDSFAEFRADIEGQYFKVLGLAGDLAERVRAGRREERYMGTGDIPNFFRKPYGPGWALVGDAGYHRDPITGQGITDAFLDAELLAAAIDDGFSGRQPLDQTLARYERQRNERVAGIYEFTCQYAALTPLPPELQQFFLALRGNAAETSPERLDSIGRGGAI